MLGLGSAMMETGDIDAGMRALAQAAPLVNTSSAYNRLGVAQTFAGQTGQAQATFAQALKLAPGDLDVESNMALAGGEYLACACQNHPLEGQHTGQGESARLYPRLEQFQEKCETIFPGKAHSAFPAELRKNKEIERFGVSVKR